MNWGIEDLTAALLLLLLAATGLWCVFSLIRAGPLRTLSAVAVIVAVAAVWAHLAVGLFYWGNCMSLELYVLVRPPLAITAQKPRPVARRIVHLTCYSSTCTTVV